MIPEHYRGSVRKRLLYATMRWLVDRDQTGLVARSDVPRDVVKRVVDRRRAVAEHAVADLFRDYFRAERDYVVKAVLAGADPLAAVGLDGDVGEVYAAAWSHSAGDWGRWAAGHFPSVSKAYEDSIDTWLRRNAGKRIAGINESTRKRVAAQIALGVDAGESVQQIARRIDRFYLADVIPHRALTIARTEVGAAQNWAQHNAAVAADVPMEKEWLSLRDDRVRDDHEEADGQRVGLDEPFEVGGDRLMYPLDASLGAGADQVINCRCGVMYHVVAKRAWGAGVEKYDPDQPRDPRGTETRAS